MICNLIYILHLKKNYLEEINIPGSQFQNMFFHSEGESHWESPFHIIVITNHQEKISHYPRDVAFENKIIWE